MLGEKPEDGRFSADDFLSEEVARMLSGMEGKEVASQELSRLVSKMRGFEADPKFFEKMLGQMARFRNVEVTSRRFGVERVVYDEVGLLGLRFGNSDVQAVIIQPAALGQDDQRMRICARGEWHEAKPDSQFDLLFNFDPTAGRETRTYAMMKDFGLEPSSN